MSGVKTWNPFYSDYRRAELCVCEQRVIFLIKKKWKRKKGFQNRHALSHAHMHTLMHTRKTFVLFLKIYVRWPSQSGFRIKREWDGPGGHAHCWAQNLLGRHLMVFTMPTATSNRHCQIQGTLVASLEDGRFWICIHIQNLKSIKKNMSLLKSHVQVENIARLSTRDTLSLQRGGRGAGWSGGSPTPLSNFRNMGHCVDHSPSLCVVQKSPEFAKRCWWVIRARVCGWHLSPAPFPCLRLRAQGGAGWRACSSPSPSTSSLPAPQCDLRKLWASPGYDWPAQSRWAPI